MTKFEQLMLRAARAQLLLSIAQTPDILLKAADDAVADIEHALTGGAIDERDMEHG